MILELGAKNFIKYLSFRKIKVYVLSKKSFPIDIEIIQDGKNI